MIKSIILISLMLVLGQCILKPLSSLILDRGGQDSNVSSGIAGIAKRVAKSVIEGTVNGIGPGAMAGAKTGRNIGQAMGGLFGPIGKATGLAVGKAVGVAAGGALGALRGALTGGLGGVLGRRGQIKGQYPSQLGQIRDQNSGQFAIGQDHYTMNDQLSRSTGYVSTGQNSQYQPNQAGYSGTHQVRTGQSGQIGQIKVSTGKSGQNMALTGQKAQQVIDQNTGKVYTYSGQVNTNRQANSQVQGQFNANLVQARSQPCSQGNCAPAH